MRDYITNESFAGKSLLAKMAAVPCHNGTHAIRPLLSLAPQMWGDSRMVVSPMKSV